MKTWKTFGLAVAACLVALPAVAQKAKTATQYYQEYTAAFEKAKSIDDVVGFLPKEQQEQIKKAPAEEKKQGFEMMKAMGAKQVKVLKETATATGATLDVEGVGGLDGGKMTGKVTLAKDASGWHIEKESWNASSTSEGVSQRSDQIGRPSRALPRRFAVPRIPNRSTVIFP